LLVGFSLARGTPDATTPGGTLCANTRGNTSGCAFPVLLLTDPTDTRWCADGPEGLRPACRRKSQLRCEFRHHPSGCVCETLSLGAAVARQALVATHPIVYCAAKPVTIQTTFLKPLHTLSDTSGAHSRERKTRRGLRRNQRSDNPPSSVCWGPSVLFVTTTRQEPATVLRRTSLHSGTGQRPRRPPKLSTWNPALASLTSPLAATCPNVDGA